MRRRAQVTRAVGAAVLVGVWFGGAPRMLGASEGAARCESTLPSCAPKPQWACFHEGMEEPLMQFCDPNDPGCL